MIFFYCSWQCLGPGEPAPQTTHTHAGWEKCEAFECRGGGGREKVGRNRCVVTGF